MTITTLHQVNTMEKPQYLPIPIKKILVDWLELHPCPTVTRSTSHSLLGGVRRSKVCISDYHYHPVVKRDLSLTVSTPNVVSVEKTSETHLHSEQGNEGSSLSLQRQYLKRPKGKSGLWALPSGNMVPLYTPGGINGGHVWSTTSILI